MGPNGDTLIYSTYLGGSGSDEADAIAVDNAGNAYVAGTTRSADFPVTSAALQKQLAGLRNAFLAKITPDGSRLIYSTYLGGGSETVSAVALDAAGNIVITGETSGAAFPLTADAYQSSLSSSCNFQGLVMVGPPANGDAFVTRVATDGASLLYSTLLGGTCGTVGQAVAIDANGNTWVSGKTSSPDFPVTGNAVQTTFGGGNVDGFLAQFTPRGSLAYSSYLGGSAYDSIDGMAFDRSGNLFLTGVSGGLTQAVSPGAIQTDTALRCIALGFGPVTILNNGVGFVAKFDSPGSSLQSLTYLGGGCLENATIAVDGNGVPWIGGSFLTPNTYYPTMDPLEIWSNPGFLSKLNPDLTQLPFSTFFPSIRGIALDPNGFAYVTGGVSVAKIDSVPAPVSLDSVAHMGSRPGNDNGFAIAPGQIVRLLGRNLGPATPVPGTITAGFVTSSTAGVEVKFDGFAAPILLAGAGEIDCVAPFELSGQNKATIQVTNNGVQSNPVEIGLIPAALEILGVFNGDFSLNSASLPAKAGTVMSLYASGLGSIVPGAADGKVNQPPYADLSGLFQLHGFIAGRSGAVPLTVAAAGPAPGAVSGVLQVNFIAPAGLISVQIEAASGFANFSTAVQ